MHEATYALVIPFPCCVKSIVHNLNRNIYNECKTLLQLGATKAELTRSPKRAPAKTKATYVLFRFISTCSNQHHVNTTSTDKRCTLYTYPVSQVEHLIGVDRLLRHRATKMLQAANKPAVEAEFAQTKALLGMLLVSPSGQPIAIVCSCKHGQAQCRPFPKLTVQVLLRRHRQGRASADCP